MTGIEITFAILLVCFFFISAIILVHNDWFQFKESFDKKQGMLDNTWYHISTLNELGE